MLFDFVSRVLKWSQENVAAGSGTDLKCDNRISVSVSFCFSESLSSFAFCWLSYFFFFSS